MKTIISVIVPVYNAQATLKECVDSILNQSFIDFELILINDGSTDNSLEICQEYASQDVRVHIINQSNAGVSAARNAGLNIAQGEWITFVDSDDYVDNDFFPIDDLKKDWELIVGCYVNKVGNTLSHPFPNLLQPQEIIMNKDLVLFLEKYLSSTILRVPWTKFFKKSLLEGISFPIDMKVGEDSYFVQRYLLNVNRVLLQPSIRYFVRVAEVAQESKYKMTVDYAKQSLRNLLQSHQALKQAKGIGPATFVGFLNYFKLVSKADWENKWAKWYADKEIQLFYKYVWDDISLFQKIKFIILKSLLNRLR